MRLAPLGLALAAALGFAADARAHLMAGRRPLDVLVAKSAAAGFAVVERGTTAGPLGSARLTRLRIITCARGPCPAASFFAAGLDEHAATYDEGRPVFVFLAAGPAQRAGRATVTWRTVETEWEARTLAAADPADLRTYVARFSKVLARPAGSREAAYLDALLDQVAAPARWLQEDALQSLLRVPAAAVTAADVERLLQAAAKTRFENVRLGAFAVAGGWNAGALRRYLAALPLETWEPGVRARALLAFGTGDAAERALPCRYTAAPEAPVRAAAVAACTPAAGWVPVCLAALDDPAPEVRRSARDRLRAAPEARAQVAAWAARKLPWWRRLYLGATGTEPAEVSEIFTPVGATSP